MSGICAGGIHWTRWDWQEKPEHDWDFGAFRPGGYKSVDFIVNEFMRYKVALFGYRFM